MNSVWKETSDERRNENVEHCKLADQRNNLLVFLHWNRQWGYKVRWKASCNCHTIIGSMAGFDIL